MKIEDLVSLTKAGYTKADIEALGILNIPESEQKPAETTEPVEAEPPKEEESKPDNDRMSALETKLDYAINRLNYMSVQNSKQSETAKTESVEDILQSILK